MKRKSLKSNEQRPGPEEPISTEPVDVVPPLPCRSHSISYPFERYRGMFTKDMEQIFLIRDKKHRDDPNIYNEAI